MSKNEILIETIAKTLKIDPKKISAKSVSTDFEEWDSLAHLKLCMAIEAKFNIQIDVDKMPELNSVSKLTDYLSLSNS